MVTALRELCERGEVARSVRSATTAVVRPWIQSFHEKLRCEITQHVMLKAKHDAVNACVQM